jgi:hypothetical protein
VAERLIVESHYPIQPLDLNGVSTYPIAERQSKVHTEMFGKPLDGSDTIPAFITKLPRILAAEGLRTLIRAILYARATNKPIIWGMGGHVIKVGLGPVINDLMENGFVTAIAMNGSGAIHDFEIALCGSTSEEVADVLGSGKFGMARETGEYMNVAINSAAGNGIGIGEVLGRSINIGFPKGAVFPHKDISILAAAYQKRIPVTVHVAIGTDIIHAHPAASGSAIGEASQHDFQLFCSSVRLLDGGGVYLNVGSAVILPEVFLKAVSVVRNLGNRLDEFTTANLDFLQHYRPAQNVLKRPTQNGGQSVSLTGHHEIMIPLIAAALKGSL